MLAVQPAGQLRIMIPMVSDIDEIRQVRAITDRLAAAAALDQPPQLGIMIETPAAAATADLLAAEADFLSIGTNDLTQYVLAVDRGNGALADRVDPLHPAVLRMIKATCDGAARHGRPVGVCGGAAGDAQAVPLLIGLGVTELSMVPGLIPEMKARVRALSMAAARALAEEALSHADAQSVRALARGFAREQP
jgi:phosphocarrier protein FPr/phosphocarrier protein